MLFSATPAGGDVRRYAAYETLDADSFDPASLPEALVWWHRRMIADAVGGAGGVVWTLNAVWPFEEDRRAIVEKMQRDPMFHERVRDMFSALPGPDDERLELRSCAAENRE